MTLFLEVIDSSREELPPAMKTISVGNINVSREDQGTPKGSLMRSLGAPLSGRDTAADPLTSDEIARLKSQVEELKEEEMNEVVDDPDEVKRAAIVAHAKKLMGAVKFVCEDLVQGVIQVAFLFLYWDEIDLSTKIFFISSVIAGLAVSLGGPVDALLKERRNSQYYMSLPKLQDNVKFQGINVVSGVSDDWTFTSYGIITLTFDEIEKRDDGKFDIKAKIVRRCVHTDMDPPKDSPDARMPEYLKKYMMSRDEARERLEGTYDISHAMLDLKAVNLTCYGPGSTTYEWADYKLKVLPDKLKGITSQQPEMQGKCAKFDKGQTVEVENEGTAGWGNQSLTLKRV